MATLALGTRVLVQTPPNCAKPFLLAEVISESDGIVRAVLLEQDPVAPDAAVNTELILPRHAVHYAQLLTSNGDEATESDNCSLSHLSDASLLRNMTLRHQRGHVYTFTGDIVTSVNPCRSMDHLYSVMAMHTFRGVGRQQMEPHVFAICERAFLSMRMLSQCQAIVITGVSGAGKTEAAKYSLQYLCWRSYEEAISLHQGSVHPPTDEHYSGEPLAHTLFRSNSVLEAFGNATTKNNPNASRFGKFIQMYFAPNGAAFAGQISTYLLEKSRTVVRHDSHQQDERSFHIFYQLAAGASDEQRRTVKIPSFDAGDPQGLKDAKAFKETENAMIELDLKPEDVMRVVSGLHHLRTVRFVSDTGGPNAYPACLPVDKTQHGHTSVAEDSQVALTIAQQLLGIVHLEAALTERTVQAGVAGDRRSIYRVPLSLEGAALARDAIVKRIYQHCFDWIVSRVNSALVPIADHMIQGMGVPVQRSPWIGLVDVFGFEVFENNSFEQLMVNLANEKLQQYFVDTIFNTEQALYLQEAVDCADVSTPGNAYTISFIESRPCGVLPLLDEQCRLGDSGSDVVLCQKLNELNPSCRQVLRTLNQRERRDFNTAVYFRLQHYVQPVTYCTTQFVEKNRDVFHSDLSDVISASSYDFLQILLTNGVTDVSRGVKPAEAKRAFSGDGATRSYETVASSFVVSLGKLIDSLRSANASFIHCIKPNSALSPGVCDDALVLQQLQSCGMVEAVKMMQSMFPTRIEYTRAHTCYDALFQPRFGQLTPRLLVSAICASSEESPDNFALGKTKVFFRSNASLHLLVILRTGQLHMANRAVVVLLIWKLWSWYREHAVVQRVMSWMRRSASKSALAQARTARRNKRARSAQDFNVAGRVLQGTLDFLSTNLSKFTAVSSPGEAASWSADVHADIKRVHAYRRLRRTYAIELVRQRASTKLQKVIRGRQQRKAFFRQKKAAVSIQAVARQRRLRHQFCCTARAVLILQAFGRRWACYRKLTIAREAILRLQCTARAANSSKRYRTVLHAARNIQGRWRAHNRQLEFARLVECTQIIQARAREMILSKERGVARNAATLIASRWHSLVVRRVYERTLAAAIAVQSAWRAYHCSKSYQETRSKVAIIAAVMRGRASRRAIRQQRLAAAKIESTIRRRVAHHQHKQIVAAQVIQSNMRRNAALRTRSLLQAVRRLQAAARRGIAIQCFTSKREAARVIQYRWRALTLGRFDREFVAAVKGLQRGGQLEKFRDGTPERHFRDVWLAKDWSRLCWGRPRQERRTLPSKSVSITAVSRVSCGLSSPALQKIIDDSRVGKLSILSLATKQNRLQEAFCFFIFFATAQGKRTTMDFVAENQQSRDQWIYWLRLLIARTGRPDTDDSEPKSPSNGVQSFPVTSLMRASFVQRSSPRMTLKSSQQTPKLDKIEERSRDKSPTSRQSTRTSAGRAAAAGRVSFRKMKNPNTSPSSSVLLLDEPYVYTTGPATRQLDYPETVPRFNVHQ